MASVKAKVYVPPVEEKEFIETVQNIDVSKIGISKTTIIYFLMIITLILFVRKLIGAACRQRDRRLQAKDE